MKKLLTVAIIAATLSTNVMAFDFINAASKAVAMEKASQEGAARQDTEAKIDLFNPENAEPAQEHPTPEGYVPLWGDE